jgi:tetratricopeptide (TPR) repeat protein
MNTAEQLLLEGQTLREQGKTFEAIDKLNRALDAFAAEKNYARFAHALLDRGICWQHLYQFHGNDPAFAILYKKDAEAMLEVLQSQNISEELDGAYFMNAKAAVIFKDYDKAVGFFQRALERLSKEKNAQRGDWRTNLGKSMYLNGEKEAGLKEIEQGISDVEKFAAGVDDYTHKVWLSGGYMRLAEVLLRDNPEQSKQSLDKAREILGEDPRFDVRQKQIANFLTTEDSGL